MAQVQKREKILMAVAGAALIVFVFNQFICSGTSEEEVPQQQSPKPAAEQKSEQVTETKPKGTPPKRKKMPTVTFSSWKKDPFAEAFRLAALDSSIVDSSFVLRGVIRKGDRAYVLIGDAILAKGERRGDLKILDIQKDRVICQKKNRIVTLALHDEK